MPGVRQKKVRRITIMTTFNEKDRIIGSAEYNTNFWNVMRGGRYATDKINDGKDVSTGGYALPAASDHYFKNK